MQSSIRRGECASLFNDSEHTVETRTATGEQIGHERLTFCYKCSRTFFALTALHELILAAL